jgi:hypothetical protein
MQKREVPLWFGYNLKTKSKYFSTAARVMYRAHEIKANI